ncbi:ABC-2 type transporter [Cellulomonas flavigena DSM 20109]|uniref:Transport permease protein n=1 Tax=Cellulomonas flavigena (strain ATCC 482 / DSM 20109 / BCRC 11376 / JCM 18109 / NBRC 3775 / NCIMB 8073 / NRS 134) TaxID=446466 RepID=D5ULA6_CELFN|nr:ABC transporter permease [Cellulomonas flavigena]ADG75988.1 ABC-2 type transporter [Cellulomonas flavigena DSM 20109]
MTTTPTTPTPAGTALSPARPGARSATRGGALARMTAVEARLFLRDPSVLFFGLLFPALLLTVLGLVMPWADEPYDADDPALAAVSAITGYTPIVLSLAVATVALSTFPAVVATYRQRGVLRRLSTTPVGPARLMVAQVVVNLVTLGVAALLAVGCGVVVLGIELPVAPLTVLLAFVLAVLSAFALGSLVAALAPTAAAANGWGMTLYFVSLFFAGVWLPLPLMPDAVQTIAVLTPLGAATQAMTAGWVGQPFPTTEVLVMAAWAVVGTPLAVRLFRWT